MIIKEIVQTVAWPREAQARQGEAKIEAPTLKEGQLGVRSR